MTIAIAKFYIAVFVFFAEAIKWYRSSSWRKTWNSTDQNFSQNFAGSLANIKRLASLIRSEAAGGSRAELRATRLKIEAIEGEIRAGRRENQLLHDQQQKATAALQSLENFATTHALAKDLWRKAGIDAAVLLLDQGRTISNQNSNQLSLELDSSVEAVENPDLVAEVGRDRPRSRVLETAPQDFEIREHREAQANVSEVLKMTEPLLDFINCGTKTIDADDVQLTLFDQRIAIALEQWTLAKSSTILYLEEPLSMEEEPPTRLAAFRIVSTANELNIPVLSFFYQDEFVSSNISKDGGKDRRGPDALTQLAYSLTYQLLSHLPPLMPLNSDQFPASRFRAIVNSEHPWTDALSLLADTLALAPHLLLCVIDGFNYLEEEEYAEVPQTTELLATLRSATESKDKTFKVLFTVSRPSFTLVRELPISEREIIEGGGSQKILGGRPRSGQSPFIVGL